jgi:stress response protein YsnF
MGLPDIETVLDWRGRTVVDREGEKIGKFDEIYLDEETSRPEWAAVTTGLFGRKQTFVPLGEAQLAGDDVQVPFDQEQVKNAPSVDPEDELSQDEEERLYEHYGLGYSRSESGTVLPEGAGSPQAGRAGGESHDGGGGQTEREEQPAADTETATPPTQSAGDTQPADEQVGRLHVGTTTRPRERVRLKKYVVTEEVTTKVPVSREEVRLEREPIDESEERPPDDEEIVLSQEEPVVEERRPREDTN